MMRLIVVLKERLFTVMSWLPSAAVGVWFFGLLLSDCNAQDASSLWSTAQSQLEVFQELHSKRLEYVKDRQDSRDWLNIAGGHGVVGLFPGGAGRFIVGRIDETTERAQISLATFDAARDYTPVAGTNWRAFVPPSLHFWPSQSVVNQAELLLLPARVEGHADQSLLYRFQRAPEQGNARERDLRIEPVSAVNSRIRSEFLRVKGALDNGEVKLIVSDESGNEVWKGGSRIDRLGSAMWRELGAVRTDLGFRGVCEEYELGSFEPNRSTKGQIPVTNVIYFDVRRGKGMLRFTRLKGFAESLVNSFSVKDFDHLQTFEWVSVCPFVDRVAYWIRHSFVSKSANESEANRVDAHLLCVDGGGEGTQLLAYFIEVKIGGKLTKWVSGQPGVPPSTREGFVRSTQIGRREWGGTPVVAMSSDGKYLLYSIDGRIETLRRVGR